MPSTSKTTPRSLGALWLLGFDGSKGAKRRGRGGMYVVDAMVRQLGCRQSILLKEEKVGKRACKIVSIRNASTDKQVILEM